MIPLNDYLRKVLITEQNTTGFTLTLADHEALKDRETLRFSNGAGDKITVRLLADFPDYVPDPIPPFPANVDHSNPFGMIGLGNQLYVGRTQSRIPGRH